MDTTVLRIKLFQENANPDLNVSLRDLEVMELAQN